MSNFSYMIDLEYFYRESGIDRNNDAKRLMKFIKRAQDINVYNLIKGPLYNKILDEIEASTLTGKYLTLTNDYLAPVIVNHAIYYYSSEDISFTNKGLQEKKSDYSQPPNQERRYDINNRLVSSTQLLEQRVIDYLYDNQGDFPEYNFDSSCVRGATQSGILRNLGLY